MNDLEEFLRRISQSSKDRFNLWTAVLQELTPRHMLEIGVFGGNFSERMLSSVPSLEQYTMLDPWKHLEGWSKPCNVDQQRFEEVFTNALLRTEFAASKRTVLRGKTSEVIHSIPDNSLDFVYIDGDHTLRGITIDLISVLPKVQEGGYIALDDFHPIGIQHPTPYDPTLVFPFALHFAEAHQIPIYALPHQQGLIKNVSGFQFIDLTGRYSVTSLNELRSPTNELRCRARRLFRCLGILTTLRSVRRMLTRRE